jgi:hypothetical protein
LSNTCPSNIAGAIVPSADCTRAKPDASAHCRCSSVSPISNPAPSWNIATWLSHQLSGSRSVSRIFASG